MLLPNVASASFSFFGLFSTNADAAASATTPGSPSPVLTAALNYDPNPNKGITDTQTISDNALVSHTGPSGTIADVASSTSFERIPDYPYVVRSGDTLSGIADMFGVTMDTILSANNLKSAKDIHPGDVLDILPVSGIKHVVAKGETLASIIKKYNGNKQEVLDYNGLSLDSQLAIGDSVIIPNGRNASAPAPTHNPVSGGASLSSGSTPGCISHYETLISGYSGPALPNYFIRPIVGGIKTQCLHGYNGVDFGVSRGTAVMAAAAGMVIEARGSGYNGGYGELIRIKHENPNGIQSIQTVYAHLSKVYVSVGDEVSQGETIGLSGNTGNSTGPHLHFEIRGAINPF